MTAAELKQKIHAVLSLGDILKQFIPGKLDDRVLQYVAAITANDELLELVVEDFFSDMPGPFGVSGQVTVASQEIDPRVIAFIAAVNQAHQQLAA